MGILKEFREFAVKGNILDLAIGVIIGGAFQKIVTSLVNDLLMPPLGLLIGRVDFSNLYINLSRTHYASLAAAKAAGAPTINIGLFINNVIDFLIMAFMVFLLVRQINRLRKRLEKPTNVEVKTRPCPYCLSEIPIKATRCGHCTSQVEPMAAGAH